MRCDPYHLLPTNIRGPSQNIPRCISQYPVRTKNPLQVLQQRELNTRIGYKGDEKLRRQTGDCDKTCNSSIKKPLWPWSLEWQQGGVVFPESSSRLPTGNRTAGKGGIWELRERYSWQELELWGRCSCCQLWRPTQGRGKWKEYSHFPPPFTFQISPVPLIGQNYLEASCMGVWETSFPTILRTGPKERRN